VKSTGAASIFLHVQQDTAYSLMITMRFQSEKWHVKQAVGLFYGLKSQMKRLSFLLRSMPIFKAIDSKNNGDFYRPECRLLNGTVLLWIQETGDVNCFSMRAVLTL